MYVADVKEQPMEESSGVPTPSSFFSPPLFINPTHKITSLTFKDISEYLIFPNIDINLLSTVLLQPQPMPTEVISSLFFSGMCNTKTVPYL